MDTKHGYQIGSGKYAGLRSWVYSEQQGPAEQYEDSSRQYKALLQERADLKAQLAELWAAHGGMDAKLTGEEANLEGRILARSAQIESLLARHEQRREYERTTPAIGAPAPERMGGVGRARYADLFGTPQPLHSWRDKEEFFSVLHSGRFDDRLVSVGGPSYQATATSGTPSDGGFSVPEPLVAGMLDAALELEIVRPRADVVPMTSETRSVWGFDAGDSSSTLYGGFSGQWVEEAGEITAETPKLRKIKLSASKLALLAQVSNELLADGAGYSEQLERALVKAIAWFLDLAFLRGTGAGQPLGVLNDPALIAVAKEVGQVVDTVVYENLAKMFARVHPASIGNSVWVANNTTIPQLLQLSIPVGTGGSHIPVLTESNGQFRMLTRPVVFTEKVPSIGDQGDISLVDFSQYQIGLRRDMSVDRSAHAGFTRDTTYYRGILRGDGQGKWDGPYTPYDGDTLSWCVTLAAR